MDYLISIWQMFTSSNYDEITIRLILATILGGIVGIEREQNNHPAGFRTHILVCVGSALIMLISMYGFEEFFNEHQNFVVSDPARLAAQVVSGIGFLGAGTSIGSRRHCTGVDDGGFALGCSRNRPSIGCWFLLWSDFSYGISSVEFGFFNEIRGAPD
ncbi:MgtC/SapB family protein [Caldalkalibacillus mannanilyticus]|uniref:MgtC/SapB family protein n=1 Tax=Caldalkalibacillus mannanilyticus TaxID=1418 RepID=UPI0034E2BF52